MNTIRCVSVALVFASVGFAQDNERKCDGGTYDMSVCLSAIYRGVEADLRDTYQRALKSATEFYPARTSKT